MSICHLITILSLVLMIQTSHPFKPPKHNIISYYKTVNNVFLTNPDNHTTSYGIYVAGETITIGIPSSVANVYDILNWKVINVDKDRLQFVHDNKPQIMIDQKSFRGIEYSGELSDSTIAFGDNEVLHAPSIFNPELTEPSYKWNYLELLYFDVKSEKVSVIRSLPWHRNDDWKFIIEWKMMDYIHFDDKLYLLIKRSIWNEKAEKFTQDVSMVRLCLDKGRELISSAVEVHFTQPEFQNIQIIEAISIYRTSVSNGYRVADWHDRKPSYGDDPNGRYNLFITLDTPNRDQMHFHTEMFNGHGDDVFDIVERMFTAGTKSSDLNLLQYHLRSESSECKKSINQLCFSDENTIPSFDVKEKTTLDVSYLEFSRKKLENQSNTVKHQSIMFGHPFSRWLFLHIQTPLSKSGLYTSFHCGFFSPDFDRYYCQSIEVMEQKWKRLNIDVEQQFFVNQRPFGGFFIAKKSHEIIFFNFNLICVEFNSCIDCIMYGYYFNCVWSHETPTLPKCKYDDQPKDKTALTVNHCFKIRHFSSSTIINSSVQQTSSIQLDTDPYIRESDKTLTIQAGSDNYCTNITEHLMLNGLNDYDNKPRIVIDQKTIEDMEFSGELSDSIIPFGDNEAFHFPSIFNPELTEPSYQWNYLELLYFGVKSAKVSVIRFLFWLKDDDCKLIKKWKMADYIHFDIKLSLLINRSIWNEKGANVTQEISIIQLCINQGSELISSAVEVQHSNPEFQNSQITEATFKLLDLGFSYSSVSKSKLTSSGNRYYDFEHIDALNREWKALSNDVQQKFFLNQRPVGGFFITKARHEIRFFNFNFLCKQMRDCFECVMFGVYFNCVWSSPIPLHYKCIYDDKPVNKTALTINSYFKVTCYYPSIFNSSVQQTLSIQFSTPLQIDYSKESLVVHAGLDNNCTNITMNDHNIQCSVNQLKSGKSNPEINLMNDKIADAEMISAISTGMVHIIFPEIDHDYLLTIITSTSMIIILSLCFYLCFTRSLVNKIDQPFSRYSGIRNDTSCNISMKLVGQNDSELTLVDHKQRIALSTSHAKVINLLCFLLILGILPTLNAFTKAPFITWRTSEKPTIIGEIHHHIFIAMKSPCPKIRLDKRDIPDSPTYASSQAYSMNDNSKKDYSVEDYPPHHAPSYPVPPPFAPDYEPPSAPKYEPPVRGYAPVRGVNDNAYAENDNSQNTFSEPAYELPPGYEPSKVYAPAYQAAPDNGNWLADFENFQKITNQVCTQTTEDMVYETLKKLCPTKLRKKRSFKVVKELIIAVSAIIGVISQTLAAIDHYFNIQKNDEIDEIWVELDN